MNVKTQTRGNCPCCGREQAVMAGGRMSKHGYTVDNGWFNGVCSGERYAPMQTQREVTDRIVKEVREEVAALEARAADLRSGRVTLGLVQKPNTYTRRGQEPEMVEWSSLPEYQQKQALNTAVYRIDSRARAGVAFADQMEALVDAVHGQPLKVVEVEAGPAPIRAGEKRQMKDRVVTARYAERGRVYWHDGRGYRSWTGSAAWRKLPLVEG